MLLDNTYTLINQLRFNLLFDNDVKKLITVKTDDIINCSYIENNGKSTIIGKVSKIGCQFNSSLGRANNAVYMKIDGSEEFDGNVVYIKPDQLLDLFIVKTSDTIDNPVCSVVNEDQKVILIRENELGLFQYSRDGITWKDAGTGPQGLSAYECAIELGYTGTEEEWLASLKGTDLVVSYSLDEKEIGTWIDGSTIYQKTIKTPVHSTTTADQDSVVINIADISDITEMNIKSITKDEILFIPDTTSDNIKNGIHYVDQTETAITANIIFNVKKERTIVGMLYTTIEYIKQ